MNIAYLCIISCFAVGLSTADQAKIERLLDMASNYKQVEKTVMLLKRPTPLITREYVYATADGTVYITGENNTIGKYVRINHAYGFTSVYGHLSEIKVKSTEHIHIGQVIGLVGSTGRSTGPHLHYGIKKNGKEQNPLPYCYLYLHWLKMLNSEGKNAPTSVRVSCVQWSPYVSSPCGVPSLRNSYIPHQGSPQSRPYELQNIPQEVYS